jgi:predicted CXXCH cytochrome family protein
MRIQLRRVAFLPLLLLSVWSLSSCVDQKTVYRDRQLFEQPSSAAGGFVGYTDTVAKLTVCGNCHVEKQTAWAQTKHASAWADLQASGHASASCEGCHTVGPNGNADSTAVGFAATGETRYHDVQCEACHGPGLTHVTSPTQANVPLAPINVSLTEACGECHNGHNAQVNEWESSMHADTTNHGITSTSAACAACHSARGILADWGVTGDYAEENTTQRIPVTCAVCHNPHGSSNEHQLRYPINVAGVNDNLCMKCHQYEGTPILTSAYAPMSPEGPTLEGTAGWWPAGQEPTTPIVGTHGNATANPGMCTTCHLPFFKGTNGQAYSGHTFEATPCLDSLGLPMGAGSTCGDSQRDFDACATSGCHGSAATAQNLETLAEQRITDLVNEVNAMVALVPKSEFSTTDNVETVGEGAKFNAQLASKGVGQVVHNPFLLEALLTTSIKALEDTYGIQPPAAQAVSLQRVLLPGVK